MKRLIFILISVISVSAYCQKLPDFGYNKVRIVETDKTIMAELIPVTTDQALKTTLFYYWFSSNAIHSTQGGFSGKLLNGHYDEFYLNRNLKAQGYFKKGLKDGVWKTWNEDGTLINATNWKNGVIVDSAPLSFWKKLNIFKKKKAQASADSIPVTKQ